MHLGEAALPTSAAVQLLQLAPEHKSSVAAGHFCMRLTPHPKPQSGDSCSEPEGGVQASCLLTLSLRVLPCCSWAV